MRSSLLRRSMPALAAAALAFGLALSATAATGPFAEFNGSWSGSGTIRPQDGNAERIRCNATYKPRGGSELEAHLKCASDSYNFDLSGQFTADSNNAITGRWSENSRGVGGTVAGVARGDRMQVHVESNAFTADLTMIMQGKRQDVTIESHGGGQVVKASIAMHRRGG